MTALATAVDTWGTRGPVGAGGAGATVTHDGKHTLRPATHELDFGLSFCSSLEIVPTAFVVFVDLLTISATFQGD
jgi:hypothetical protein